MSTSHTIKSRSFVLTIALFIFIIGLPDLIVPARASNALSEFLRYSVQVVPIRFILLVLFITLFENFVISLVIILSLVFEL